jgi:hypothetical protein
MDVYFASKGKKPYVKELYNLDFQKGVIEFNGYYYEDEENLPQKVTMFFQNNKYEIEIYKMEILENTSVYFDDEEFGKICLFPTYKMQLFFTSLNQVSQH